VDRPVSDRSGGGAAGAGGAPLARARRAGAYVACYVLWLVTAALGLLVVVALRQLVEWAYVALHFDKWGLGATSDVATVVFGIVWLGVTTYTESAYREGVAQGTLWRRFVKVTLIQAVPLVLALIVWLLRRAF
jgi:hypothetical protein